MDKINREEWASADINDHPSRLSVGNEAGWIESITPTRRQSLVGDLAIRVARTVKATVVHEIPHHRQCILKIFHYKPFLLNSYQAIPFS